LIISGELETDTRANQAYTLHQPGTIHWDSHFSSIKSLIELFGITRILLSKIDENGPNSQFHVDAFKYYLAMTSFDFVIVLLLMNKVIGVIYFLCQMLKRKRSRYYKCLKFCFTCKISTSMFEG
jgi:hypothetical protein